MYSVTYLFTFISLIHFFGVYVILALYPKTTNEIVAMYSLQINFPRQEESLPKKPLIPFVQCQLLVQKLAWCYHSQKPDQNFTSGRQRLYLVCSRSSTLLKKEFNRMRYIFIDLYVSCLGDKALEVCFLSVNQFQSLCIDRNERFVMQLIFFISNVCFLQCLQDLGTLVVARIILLLKLLSSLSV